MLKNDARIFLKYLPEICDFHKEITIFTKKRAILHVDITKNIAIVRSECENSAIDVIINFL
jgi:hypothetical protein